MQITVKYPFQTDSFSCGFYVLIEMRCMSRNDSAMPGVDYWRCVGSISKRHQGFCALRYVVGVLQYEKVHGVSAYNIVGMDVLNGEGIGMQLTVVMTRVGQITARVAVTIVEVLWIWWTTSHPAPRSGVKERAGCL